LEEDIKRATQRGYRGKECPLCFSFWGENFRKGEAPPPEKSRPFKSGQGHIFDTVKKRGEVRK